LDSIHDLGGMHGFGPIVRDDAVFHAAWEARLFALSEVATGVGITAGHFREAIESLPPAQYLAASYYERWLFGLERRLERAHTVAPGDVEEAMARLGEEALPRRTDPPFARRCVEAQRAAAALPPAAAARFAAGDRVRVRRMRPEGHTRCPRYVRGASGVVERVHGDDVLPDAAARGEHCSREAVYAVRFRSRDLFGDGPEPPFAINVDLSESYLETRDDSATGHEQLACSGDRPLTPRARARVPACEGLDARLRSCPRR
jgi:nitrile hydratase